jgi:aminoglycoside/choline kinase family phosphotransferase
MNTNTDTRLQALQHWAAEQTELGLQPDTLEVASADASFRRYFRLRSNSARHPTVILMDAPPPQENVRPFIDIAGRLWGAGVNVPQVLAADVDRGFLALTDLGNSTYLSVLSPDNARSLYQPAWEAMVKFQVAAPVAGLPAYDHDRLVTEMMLFPQWYCEKHRGIVLTDSERNDLQSLFENLARDALSQGGVLVHRDYHSRNLMQVDAELAEQAGWPAGPGILDFQDAVVGPATYDLVSLLRDAYIEWDRSDVLDWAIRYWELAKKAGVPVASDPAEFFRQFEWMGLQRHLKVLGIFARLYHRDGKDGYLKDLPLVMAYTRQVAQAFSVFKPLVRLLDRIDDTEVKVGYTF